MNGFIILLANLFYIRNILLLRHSINTFNAHTLSLPPSKRTFSPQPAALFHFPSSFLALTCYIFQTTFSLR
jgi:hypothetical protein